MTDSTAQKLRYDVIISVPEEQGAGLLFNFSRKGIQADRGAGGIPNRIPHFLVTVLQEGDRLHFQWNATSDDPGPSRGEIEAEITVRMEDRSRWIKRVTALVSQVEQWARELNWSTRRVEKKLDDSWIGKYRVPAL